MKNCEKKIKAVCDCGASVSCLSPLIFDELKQAHKLDLKPCLRKPRFANGLPIEVKSFVRVPVVIGPKSYEHDSCFLYKSEADYLLGLDFFETNECDPLFSCMKLKLDSNTFVPLYLKQFEYGRDIFFRVIVTEKLSVPPGHTRIIPAHIANWKRPPIQVCALFEHKDKFEPNNEVSAPNVLFDLTEEVIPIAINNKTEEFTIYKNRTLGFSEILPEAVINNISKLPKPLPAPIKKNKYDLNKLKKSVDKDIPKRFHDQFGSLVKEFSDIFSQSEWDLGKCDVITHRMEVEPGSKPVQIPTRRMPLHYKEDVQKKIDVFLEKELTTPCHSPNSAPAKLVPKKNGKPRLVNDYRQLNKQTIQSTWPIPSIEELFDTLEGSAYFTSIDMSAGFYQVPTEASSQDYTAFSTPFGSLKWLRMPMGLTGSPPTFQCLVQKVLVGLTWKICVPYLDDNIIFSSTPEEHLERLRLVFQRFRAHHLKINPDKCDFFRMKVQFLGHIVSKDGLEVDPSKIEAVQKFPVLRSQTEVKSFFGLASYYRRFVPKFAEIARPLHTASETSTKFEWTPEAQDALESLKLKLTSTPILVFPFLKEPFILYTYASQFAVGSVLAQVQDGKERAFCYASKSFSKSPTKYSATRRELLALVTFTRPFRHHLLGQKFTIATDHSALQWLHSFKDPDGITARSLEKFPPFDYEVRHRPRKSISHADGLPRIPPNSIIAIETDLPLTAPQNETPKVSDIISNYQEVIGNVFDSKYSIAHCVSADFKMSAGIARHFKRKFPTKYPTDLDHSYTPLRPQWLPERRRYLYHLVTKEKYFNKPTYSTLRASLERMRKHAENNSIPRISMPCIGTGLDQLDWDKVKLLIRETFCNSPVQVVVYILPDPEIHRRNISVEDEPTIEFAQAQEAEESLKHVRRWNRQKIIPTQNELQGLPRLAWQLYNQLGSLFIQDGFFCREFEPMYGRLA